MNVHRYSEALSNLSSATEIYIETHSKDDVEVIDLLNNLACCYLQVFKHPNYHLYFQSVLHDFFLTERRIGYG